MKTIFLYLVEAGRDLSKNKGRSILTSLGIIIGVYSVVLLLAFGEGLKIYIEDQFASLGTNLIYVLPGKISGNAGPGAFGGKRFTLKDLGRLKAGLAGTLIVPATVKNITAISVYDKESTSLFGSTRDIFIVRNFTLSRGRYFSRNEEIGARKVIVLGPKIATTLFGNRNPIRQTVKVQGLSFTVVGVLEAKGGGGFGGPDFDTYAYTPYKTAWLFTTDKTFLSFYIQPPSKEAIPALVSKTKRIMLRDYKDDDFSVTTQEELIGTISSIFGVINTVLVGIAAISLLVGGIGITNIMFVTVTERTREIGIRRAIGAKESNILYQFLAESALLTTLGGLAALVLAFLTTLLINNFFPAKITPYGMGLAFGVSFFIGIVFGVFPARKAAKMSPVEAIRYE